ncbi:MAG: TrmH family RNA methyltransferase [Longimicrobiales bacterium]
MSLSRRERGLIASLRQRKHRESEGLFLAEGVRVVEELLVSPLVPRLALVSSSLEDTERGRALRTALERTVETRRLTDRELAELAATETPQGVLVAAEIPPVSLTDLPASGAGRILVLDAVQDPGNVGALVRTAAALGAGGVVALPGTADPWNEKAVRAAAGATFRLPVTASAWAALEPWLDAHGYGIYVADAGGAPMDGIVAAGAAAVVVGNEGAGVRQELRAAARAVVAVPTREVESLNVAVAAGILLWELARRAGEGR